MIKINQPKKYITQIGLLLIFVLIFVGCSSQSDEESSHEPENKPTATSFKYQLAEVLPEFDIAALTITELRNKYAFAVSISSSALDEADYLVDGLDDEQEINEAISSAYDVGGGLVFLYPGTYSLSKSIIVLDNVTLKGAGRVAKRATILMLVDNAESMLGKAGIVRFKNDSENDAFDKRVNNAVIEDLIIDGNRDNQLQDVGDSEKKYGLYSEGDNLVFRRITVRNCMGYGFDPHATVDTFPSRRLLIENNYSHHNYKDGFTLDYVENSIFQGNVSELNARHGLNMVTGSNSVEIFNNIIRDNDGEGISVQNGAANLTITDNEVYRNKNNGIKLRASDYNVINQNAIVGNGRIGVELRGSSHNKLLNNFIGLNSTSKNSYFELELRDYNDIGSTNNNIHSNTFSVQVRGAIRERDTADFNTIRENNIRTNATILPVSLIGSSSYEAENITIFEES